MREVRAKGDVPIWREDEHGKAFSLKILKAGRLAVEAIAPDSAESDGLASGDEVMQSDRAAASKVQQPSKANDAGAARPGTKRAAILALLSREDGATIQTLMNATGWLPHTTRAALTGLRKGGFAITRRRDADADASVYRIEPAMVAAAS